MQTGMLQQKVVSGALPPPLFISALCLSKLPIPVYKLQQLLPYRNISTVQRISAGNNTDL